MLDGEINLMSTYIVFKLECMKFKHKLSHFALRAKIYQTKPAGWYNEFYQVLLASGRQRVESGNSKAEWS